MQKTLWYCELESQHGSIQYIFFYTLSVTISKKTESIAVIKRVSVSYNKPLLTMAEQRSWGAAADEADGTWQCSTSSGNTWMTDLGPPCAPKRSNSSIASRAACKQPENMKKSGRWLLSKSKCCVPSLPWPFPQSCRWAPGCLGWFCRLFPTCHNPKQGKLYQQNLCGQLKLKWMQKLDEQPSPMLPMWICKILFYEVIQLKNEFLLLCDSN